MKKNSIMNLDFFNGKVGAEESAPAPTSVKKSIETKEPTPAPTPVDTDEYLLVTIDADYADEFDVCQSYVMTKETFDEYVKESKENIGTSRNFEIYFGTNEALYLSDFNDYMSNISTKSITKEDYESYNRMFGGGFGMIGHYFPYGCY